MKECAAEWKQMKAAKTTNGMKYKDFSKQCMTGEPDRRARRPPKPNRPPPPPLRPRRKPHNSSAARRQRATPGQADVARPRSHDRARARLRRRMEGRQGRRQDPGRHEVAAILERVRQAQKSRRHVRRSASFRRGGLRQPSLVRPAAFGSGWASKLQPADLTLAGLTRASGGLVGGAGIEPATPSMSRKCSPAELTARSRDPDVASRCPQGQGRRG